MTPPRLDCAAASLLGLFIISGSAQIAAEEAKRVPAAAPVAFKAGTFLEKDYRTQERAWADKHLLAPALARWQGQPWAGDAEQFCRAALDAEIQGFWTDLRIGALAPDATKLLQAGCRDALVANLAWRALYGSRGNWRDGEVALDIMCTQLPDRGHCNGALAMFIGTDIVKLAGARSKQADSERHRLEDAIHRALTDDSYDESSEPVLVRHAMAGLDTLDTENTAILQSLMQAIEQSRYSQWAKDTLLGYVQKHAAWAQRGSGWASSVTPEGWQGFADSLKKARAHLESAWKLRPDRPEAAAAIIGVSMGEGADLLDQRRWFDHAISVQPDYPAAYRFMHYTSRPRWNGSHEIMAQFGAACADTRRFDTAVPGQVFIAATNIAEELPDASRIFTAPAFGGVMRTTIEGYLAQQGLSANERRFYASCAAVAAYLINDPELCQRALDIAGPKLNQHAVAMLHTALGHETELRAETAALLGRAGPEIKELLLKLGKRDRAGTEQFLKDTKIEGLPPESRSIFEEVGSNLSFERKFDSGAWVPLTIRPGLTTTGMTGGQWAGTEKGELILTGDDTKWSHCYFRSPVASKDVEIRGEITFEIPDKSVVRDGFGFGPMLGWLPDSFNGGKPGARGLITDYGGGREEAHVVSNAIASSTGKVHSPFTKDCTFHLNIHGGKVTYIVNDRLIADRKPLENIGMDDGRGFTGFTAFRFPWGAKAIVKKVEVRKSTAAPANPAVTAKKVANSRASGTPAAATTVAQTPASSKKWQFIVLVVLVIAAVFVTKFVRPAQD